MKEIPPSLANAIAMVSLDTDCITAETMGMFMERGHSSPFLNRTMGVRRLTLDGIQSADEYPGTKRYSPKVWEGSSK